MKIYVLGHRGMLGRYVYTYLRSQGHSPIGIGRDKLDIVAFNDVQLRAALFYMGLKKGDVIINCIGTIKPMVDKHGTLNAIKVNSLFPHFLAEVCEKEGYKMIHISTDCVFSGNGGKYTEDSLHDCTDVYGKTKSLGEPKNCTIVRTSILGEEVNSNRSLIEWIKSKKNDTANGFTNHLWNGLTCLQIAKVFENIIVNNKFWKGVKHIPSPNIVTKLEMLQMVNKIYDLNINIIPTEATIRCDRSLLTILNDGITFNIPDLETQIQEQKDFYPILSTDL